MIFSGIFQLRGKDMSDFNKIMAFQQMMPYLNKEQQDNLATTLGMELQEIERRLVGKNKEDEFILILLFMEVCKSITAFDEGVSQLLKTATSDLLVELQNEKKFMLEIKHTDKERYSISMGNLQKRIDYASKYLYELFFSKSINFNSLPLVVILSLKIIFFSNGFIQSHPILSRLPQSNHVGSTEVLLIPCNPIL